MALSGEQSLHAGMSKWVPMNSLARRSASWYESATQITSSLTLVSSSGSRPASAAYSRTRVQSRLKLGAV